MSMPPAGKAMDKSRVEAFSDGVIAVAITLLVLDIRVPAPHGAGSLAHHLGEQWPHFAAYAVSFLTIGVIWVNHHAMLRRLVSVDHSILALNVLLLMTIVLLPFTTGLMAEYLTSSTGARLAAAVYGGSFLLMSLAFMLMQRHILINRTHLLHEHLTRELRLAVLRRNAVGIAPYVLATVGALITPFITLGICAALAVFFALPATTSDAVDGR